MLRVVLTGASGQLGTYLLDALCRSGHSVAAWSGPSPSIADGQPLTRVDVSDADGVAASLEAADPDAILHVAAVSKPADVARDPRRGWVVNVEGTRNLVHWAAVRGRRLLFTSSDLVFDGARGGYREDDAPHPLVEYGRTKLAAERIVLGLPRGLVARISLQFGPSRCGRASYFDEALAALRRGEPRAFFVDEFRSPLDFATTARLLVCLLEGGATGLLHVAGAERLSRFDLMRRIAAALGIDPRLVRGNRQAEMTGPEPRPADVSLDTTRLAALLPGLERPSVEAAARSWRLA